MSTSYAPPPAPERSHYRHTAPHIRGHLEHRRDDWWDVVVTNTATGHELTRTDAHGFASALTMAHEIVAVARAAWFWSMDADLLRARQPKTLKIRPQDAQAIMTVLVGGQPYQVEDLTKRLTLLLG